MSSLEVPEAYKIFLGTFRLEESTHFEEFMSKLGVSPFWLLSDGVNKPVTVISYLVQLGQWKMETRYPPILASHLTALCTTQDSFEKGRADV